MEINTTQEKLLTERGVIVLPEAIEHETYETVLALLMLAETEWADDIRLFCAGGGGSMSAALSIVDLVQGREDIVGILPGIAESAHATIFAACEQRYAYPSAQIGIHQISWRELGTRQDATSLRLRQQHIEILDNQLAQLLARCTDDGYHNASWWLQLLQETGSDGCAYLNAVWMHAHGFALPVAEYGQKALPEEGFQFDLPEHAMLRNITFPTTYPPLLEEWEQMNGFDDDDTIPLDKIDKDV